MKQIIILFSFVAGIALIGTLSLEKVGGTSKSSRPSLIKELDVLDSGHVLVVKTANYEEFIAVLRNGENDQMISIGNESFVLSIDANRYYLDGDLYDLEIPITDTIGQMSFKKTWIVDPETESEN